MLGESHYVGAAGIYSSLVPRFLLHFVAWLAAPEKRFLVHLARAQPAHRFDESLDLFRRITGADLVDFWVTDMEDWTPLAVAGDLLPADIWTKMIASHEPNKRDLSFTHEDLPFLTTVKDMMGFSSSEIRVDATERSTELGDTNVHLGNLLFRFGWEDGTFISHAHLSYGQKRLVTFFYYLACNSPIVIADELVNGLHHRWITASIEALGERQAFLTSQNPLLLDYIPITSVAEVRRSFVLCRGEPREGRPGSIWENMSEDDARELFSAYEVGVEHVSEILQSRGLW